MTSSNFSSLYDIIWSESFWFPGEVKAGWKDLENRPGSDHYYPDLKDLNWSLVFSLVLLAIRYIWENMVVVPIGVKLGLSNKKRQPVTPNPQLEAAYKKKKRPDSATIQGLSKQTDMTERQVEVWFRKRGKQDMLTPMQKFRECSWHLVFYTTYFIYGLAVLWKKPYFWRTINCWEGWPKQHVSSDVYWYYVVELSFYWSLIITLVKDNKRKDFVEMTVHHFATIILMYFSWMLNFVRVGTLVLVVHDAADTWLALAKMSIYIKNKLATDIFFGIFLVVWVISRLIVYPFVVLYCTTVEPYTAGIMSVTFGAHQFFNFFLYLLQVLHIIWSYLIFRIVYRKIVKGNVEDVRSDSEDNEDESEDEEEVKDAQKPLMNGMISNGSITHKTTESNGPVNGGVKHGKGVKNGLVMPVGDHATNGITTDKVTTNGVGNGDINEGQEKDLPNSRQMSPSKIPRARRN